MPLSIEQREECGGWVRNLKQNANVLKIIFDLKIK